MQVLMVAAENDAIPGAKVGGVADVLAGLRAGRDAHLRAAVAVDELHVHVQQGGESKIRSLGSSRGHGIRGNSSTWTQSQTSGTHGADECTSSHGLIRKRETVRNGNGSQQSQDRSKNHFY